MYVPRSWVGRRRVSPWTLGWALIGGISPWHDAGWLASTPLYLPGIYKVLVLNLIVHEIHLNNPPTPTTLVPNGHRRHSLHQEGLDTKKPKIRRKKQRETKCVILQLNWCIFNVDSTWISCGCNRICRCILLLEVCQLDGSFSTLASFTHCITSDTFEVRKCG